MVQMVIGCPVIGLATWDGKKFCRILRGSSIDRVQPIIPIIETGIII